MATDPPLAPAAARYEISEPILAGDASAGRNGLKWLVGVLFFVTLCATLASLQLFQLTAEGPAKRALRRSVAALTEIDPLIDRNYDDLQQRAASAAPADQLQLREFPIDVPLSREQAMNASKQELRELLLQRSSDVMYDNGTAPLRSSASGKGSVGMFSIGGLTDHGLGFLRSRNHDILGGLTFVLAALSAFLCVTLVVLCRGFGRLAAVGAVVLAASAVVLGFAILARISMNGGDEYLQREFYAIGRSLVWIPIRNGIAFTLLGALMLVTGVGLAKWSDARDPLR